MRLGEHRQRRADPAVVRVEQIARGRGRGDRRRHRPLAESLERERPVRGRAREPRRRPELAHEEPVAGLGDVAPPRGVDRPLERGVQDRRPDRRTGAGERRGVESGRRRLRVVERAPGGGEIRGPTGEHAFHRAASGIDLRLDRGRIAEDDRRLGIRQGETGAEALSHGGAASAPVASQRLATETTPRRTRRRMGYWTIFTFSRAAACVT